MATSAEIITASPDLKALFDDGFEVGVKASYLLVRNVPYLDDRRAVCRGTLIMVLPMATDIIVGKPPDHVTFFAGKMPHFSNGDPINAILHEKNSFNLADGVAASFRFSSRPEPADPDFNAKVRRYVDLLSGPARVIDPHATAQTRQILEVTDEDSPFVYADSHSARAQIVPITAKLKGGIIGIVGLGGTGSYVLDAVAKCPVQEIHVFDDDEFSLNNAYRSPGAPTLTELRARMTKVAYHTAIYLRMHRRVHPHETRITAANVEELAKLSFAFLCMDPGPDKAAVVAFLVDRKIPFIDTGLGVEAGNDQLHGIVNTITVTPAHHTHIGNVPVKSGGADELYASNIQIAELNMLNAVMAVIRWKKHMGFYANDRHEHESSYSIGPNMLTNEEIHR
ncbi:MAG TPA: ThiF family adenylyltransferase [Lacunisphaera sp.]